MTLYLKYLKAEHLSMVENRMCHVDESDYAGLSSYLEQLTFMTTLTHTFVSVYDLHRHNFLYHSFPDRTQELYPVFAWKSGLVDLHYSERVHPEDVPMLLNAHIDAYRLLDGLPQQERLRKVLGCLVRVQNGRGSYRLMYYRMAVCRLDRQGNPWLVMVHSTLLTDCAGSSVPRGFCLETLSWQNGQMELNCNESKVKIITDREFQLLGLVIAGYENYQIAELMGISLNTVDQHRRNLEHHIGAKDMPQAIVFALRLGLH